MKTSTSILSPSPKGSLLATYQEIHQTKNMQISKFPHLANARQIRKKNTPQEMLAIDQISSSLSSYIYILEAEWLSIDKKKKHQQSRNLHVNISRPTNRSVLRICSKMPFLHLPSCMEELKSPLRNYMSLRFPFPLCAYRLCENR